MEVLNTKLHANHKRHASNHQNQTLITAPHLPAVQTPAQQRTYTRAHSLNLAHLDLGYPSGLETRGQERRMGGRQERKGVVMVTEMQVSQ